MGRIRGPGRPRCSLRPSTRAWRQRPAVGHRQREAKFMRRFAATIAGILLIGATEFSAQRGGKPSAPPPPPKAASPIDLTGYWVSVISEDWRWRMVTPARGEYTSIPINAAAKKI